jgi:hypothetical protein
MLRIPALKPYRPAFGMTALVLGHIALMLFFLPVLGIPLSACGLAFGGVGVALALLTGASSLRWGVAGVAASGLALAVNLALARAPESHAPDPRRPRSGQVEPARPYIPPPARVDDR